MKITEKGQVAIPKDLGRQASLEPGDEVFFIFEEGRVIIEPATGIAGDANERRLSRVMKSLQALEGSGNTDLTADDIVKMTRDR